LADVLLHVLALAHVESTEGAAGRIDNLRENATVPAIHQKPVCVPQRGMDASSLDLGAGGGHR
jgi:hypothetical protein